MVLFQWKAFLVCYLKVFCSRPFWAISSALDSRVQTNSNASVLAEVHMNHSIRPKRDHGLDPHFVRLVYARLVPVIKHFTDERQKIKLHSRLQSCKSEFESMKCTQGDSRESQYYRVDSCSSLFSTRSSRRQLVDPVDHQQRFYESTRVTKVTRQLSSRPGLLDILYRRSATETLAFDNTQESCPRLHHPKYPLNQLASSVLYFKLEVSNRRPLSCVL